MSDRCDGHYEEPLEVTYRCGLEHDHEGQHGPIGEPRPAPGWRLGCASARPGEQDREALMQMAPWFGYDPSIVLDADDQYLAEMSDRLGHDKEADDV